MSKEQLKIDMEYQKVKAAKYELRYRLAEKEEEVERIKEHIELQDKRLAELQNEITKEG